MKTILSLKELATEKYETMVTTYIFNKINNKEKFNLKVKLKSCKNSSSLYTLKILDKNKNIYECINKLFIHYNFNYNEFIKFNVLSDRCIFLEDLRMSMEYNNGLPWFSGLKLAKSYLVSVGQYTFQKYGRTGIWLLICENKKLIAGILIGSANGTGKKDFLVIYKSEWDMAFQLKVS